METYETLDDIMNGGPFTELERDLHPFIQQRPTKTLSPLLMTPALSSPRLTPKKGDLSISYSSGLVVRRNVLSV